MSTMNISLTSDQVKLVNNLTKAHDFANRSEFFRSLLRLVSYKPQILTQADELILESPMSYSTAQVKKQLKSTGKYSPKFIASVAKGLNESGYFTN